MTSEDQPLPLLTQPKVFLSYSWTTPEHRDQVRQWAERLMSDGVEVVIDIFDLKEGQDKFHFMERMITDSSITNVLLLSDSRYTSRANEREAGVGTESQIISSEIYGKVAQSKFVPIVCEFNEAGEPWLPAFITSRIFIDFSSAEAVNQNWEQLVRFLFGKPLYKKPPLGNPPSYLLANTETSHAPLLGKFATLKQALSVSSRTTSGVRADFLEACFEFGVQFKILKDPQLTSDALAKQLLLDLTELKVLRDVITDWVLLESSTSGNDTLRDDLFTCLEQLLVLKSRPESMSSWQEAWFEGLNVFVYQTFLYIVAALLKTRSYVLLGEVLGSSFMKPRSELYSSTRRFGGVDLFYGHSELLGRALQEGNQRLHSPAAQLIVRQADRQDLPFIDLLQAELIVFLKAICFQEFRWFPQTLIYARGTVPDFFVRAAQRRNFKHLAAVIGIADADELRTKASKGYEDTGIANSHIFFMAFTSPWHYLNAEQYDTI